MLQSAINSKKAARITTTALKSFNSLPNQSIIKNYFNFIEDKLNSYLRY